MTEESRLLYGQNTPTFISQENVVFYPQVKCDGQDFGLFFNPLCNNQD